MRIAGLSLILLLVGGPARADWPETIELADGTRLAGRVLSVADGKVGFATTQGEKPRLVALDKVARVVRLPYCPSGRRADGLALTNGDILEGRVIHAAAGKLTFASVRFGELALELSSIRAIVFDQPIDAVGARAIGAAAAGVLLVSGSRTPAELRWIDGNKLGLSSPLGPLEVDRDTVAWVLLAGSDRAAPGKGDVRLRLTTGEVLTGRLDSLDDGRATFHWNGLNLQLAWDVVRGVESAGERFIYLSHLPPRSLKQAAQVGPARPPTPGCCAAGGPLCLDGAIYEQGIGMRARSQATYELDGKWQRFRAVVGLDDRAAGASRGAIFVVELDGKKALEKEVLPGDRPAEVDLPVRGVRELTLVLEPGPGLDVGDYGNWVDARLLREGT